MLGMNRRYLASLIILFTSVVSPVFGGVMSIEAVNKNAISVNYESSSQANKSKVECVLRDEIGNIVGEMAEKNREWKDLKVKAVKSGVAA